MKCFYHNDLDGRCAGALVAHFTNQHAREDFFEVDYTKPLPLDLVEKGETVYFVDYSFTDKTMDQLEYLVNGKKCSVVWIDHHTSSLKICEKFTWLAGLPGIRSDDGSGALLVYKWFRPCEEVPYFVKLVSDYDCWKYEFAPYTDFFKLGIESREDDALDRIWEELIWQWDTNKVSVITDIIKKGKTIKKFITQTNDYYREHFCYISEISGIPCAVVNWKTNSWVFGDLVNKYPITMVWVFDGEFYSYSIFSIDPTVNCCGIAESYGGGGHKGAAGFKSTELLFKKVRDI